MQSSYLFLLHIRVQDGGMTFAMIVWLALFMLGGLPPHMLASGHWYGDRAYKAFLTESKDFSLREKAENNAKSAFIESSIRHEHCFENDELPDKEISDIIDWLAGRSAEEVSTSRFLSMRVHGFVPCRSTRTGSQ